MSGLNAVFNNATCRMIKVAQGKQEKLNICRYLLASLARPKIEKGLWVNPEFLLSPCMQNGYKDKQSHPGRREMMLQDIARQLLNTSFILDLQEMI